MKSRTIGFCIVAAFILVGCSKGMKHIETVSNECDIEAKGYYENLKCKCDGWQNLYRSGKTKNKRREQYHQRYCTENLYYAEKVKNGEMSKHEADMKLLENSRLRAEEHERSRQELLERIRKQMHVPQTIQSPTHCTSRRGYGGVINTTCM